VFFHQPTSASDDGVASVPVRTSRSTIPVNDLKGGRTGRGRHIKTRVTRFCFTGTSPDSQSLRPLAGGNLRLLSAEFVLACVAALALGGRRQWEKAGSDKQVPITDDLVDAIGKINSRPLAAQLPSVMLAS
jgi:hypothetical protein